MFFGICIFPFGLDSKLPEIHIKGAWSTSIRAAAISTLTTLLRLSRLRPALPPDLENLQNPTLQHFDHSLQSPSPWIKSSPSRPSLRSQPPSRSAWSSPTSDNGTNSWKTPTSKSTRSAVSRTMGDAPTIICREKFTDSLQRKSKPETLNSPLDDFDDTCLLHSLGVLGCFFLSIFSYILLICILWSGHGMGGPGYRDTFATEFELWSVYRDQRALLAPRPRSFFSIMLFTYFSAPMV